MNINQRLLLISVLGAHSNSGGDWFRQKDLRFLVDVFTNWMDVMLKPELPAWHNTQIMRFLDGLVEGGRAKLQTHAKRRRYRLTRVGLLELISELTDMRGYSELRHSLLVYYFLVAYRGRMIELIGRAESGFSKAVQLEIEHLFDHRRFLQQQILHTELQVKRIRLRVKDGLESAADALKLQRQGLSVAEIIEQVSRAHPYELEAQRPMAEALRSIEPTHQFWEIHEGTIFRAEILWRGQLESLEGNLEILKRLAARG